MHSERLIRNYLNLGKNYAIKVLTIENFRRTNLQIKQTTHYATRNRISRQVNFINITELKSKP